MIKGNERISGAEERWSQYRMEITDYIQKECQRDGRLLILGAGACDDIDLKKLLDNKREIWLADINHETLEAAVNKIKKKQPEAVSCLHIVETDLVCIAEQDYEEYVKALQQGMKAIHQWWEDYSKRFQESYGFLRDIRNAMRQEGIERIDSAVCLGLHSQLYMELVLRTRKLQTQLASDVYAEALRLIQEANCKMAEGFMEEIRGITKKLILGLEYTTIFREETALEETILQILMTTGTSGLQAMQLSRVEGAFQLEQELGNCCRQNKVRLMDYQYFWWPFLEEKSYLMVIFSILCYN